MDRKTRWEAVAVAAPFDVRWRNRRRGALPLACEGGYRTASDLRLPAVDSPGFSRAKVTTIESSARHPYQKHSFGPSSDVASFGRALIGIIIGSQIMAKRLQVSLEQVGPTTSKAKVRSHTVLVD